MRKNLITSQVHVLPFKTELKEQSEKGMIRNYFIDELRSLYWSEKYLLKTLPKLENGAVTTELKEILEDHSSVTDDHVERIEQIFQILIEITQVKKCDAMDSMIKEANQIVYKLDQSSFTRDFAMVVMVNKIQNYQIAAYESLIHMARILREPLVEGILMRSLSDEKKAKDIFTNFSNAHLTETNLLETESEL